MSVRPKRLPRLWCALQGLLPLHLSGPEHPGKPSAPAAPEAGGEPPAQPTPASNRPERKAAKPHDKTPP